MIIRPNNDWVWAYTQVQGENAGNFLSLHTYINKNQEYDFLTLYRKEELNSDAPLEEGLSFTIRDGQLLSAFQEGLDEIDVEESQNLVVSLNATACTRFVSPKSPVGRFFHDRGNARDASIGKVVSLYSTCGAIGDFIVLETDYYRDGLATVMLINDNFVFNKHLIKIGDVIRVPKYCLWNYRLNSYRRKSKYYA